jgi:hypothetical protein
MLIAGCQLCRLIQERKTHGLALLQVAHAAGPGQVADPAMYPGPFGDTDGAPGIQQIEGVAALEGEFIGGKHQAVFDNPFGFGFIAC